MNYNIKRLGAIFIILLFMIIPFSFASDGDYTIPEATVDLNISENGTVIVTESIVQDIEGRVNGSYRVIPLKDGQSISNLTVETPGYYNKVDVISNSSEVKIKVWLYKDKAKTQKINNEKVRIIYRYTFNKLVKLHNDVAELQFISWGDMWESHVDKLSTTIHIPGSHSGVEAYNNPDFYVATSEWTNDKTLRTELEGIPSNTQYEQRLLIPTAYFNNSSDNFFKTGVDARDKIQKMQQEYADNYNFQSFLAQVIDTIVAVLFFVPLGIYGLFGREPKVNYDCEYEYDIPTDDSPLFVNSVVIGDVGKLDVNAYNSTLLQLIDKKYYTVIASNDVDTIIRQSDKDMGPLKKYERDIITYLSKFRQQNGDISFNYIKDTCNPQDFLNHVNLWMEETKGEISEERINIYFESRGSDLLQIFGVLIIIFSSILGIYLIFANPLYNVYMVVILFIFGMILIGLPNTFAGRWTTEGKEYHDRWKAFEKYIRDYSMIEEYPPASIQVWGRYLVYATALGCAKEVSDNMFKYFESVNMSNDYLYESDIVYFSYYGGLYNMTSSFSDIRAEATSSDSISSVGGGSGGGGGGTF